MDPLIAAYQLVVDTDRAYRQANGDAQHRFSADAGGVRALIAEIKTNPAFTDGMGAAMRIFSTSGGRDAADIKPVITAIAERGHVRLAGTKNYAETVNLYLRRKAGPAGEWSLIGVKRKRLPFDDQTPLATPGVPRSANTWPAASSGTTRWAMTVTSSPSPMRDKSDQWQASGSRLKKIGLSGKTVTRF